MTDNIKPSLFFLSGFLCDERVWDKQIAALEPYADITIPAFRNMNSLKEMAQSVLDIAPQKFSIIGHSMGGRIAFEIIHLAQARIDKIAVLDTAVHPLKSDETAKRQVLIDLAKDFGMQALAEEWTKLICNNNKTNKSNLSNTVLKMAQSYSFNELKNQIQALLERDDQSKYLQAIHQHVLLICGEQDQWSPVSQHEEMTQDLANSNLITLENCGHMATLEQPDKLNEVLLSWFCS